MTVCPPPPASNDPPSTFLSNINAASPSAVPPRRHDIPSALHKRPMNYSPRAERGRGRASCKTPQRPSSAPCLFLDMSTGENHLISR